MNALKRSMPVFSVVVGVLTFWIVWYVLLHNIYTSG